MTPAATKSAKPDIVLLANAEGQVKNVVPTAKGATKKAPARKRKASSSAEDLNAAADELLAKADGSTKTSEGKTKKAATKATSVKSAAKKTTAKKAATPKAKTAAPELTAEEKAKAASAEKEAKAKALASIKIGPKGVYTEDSIRVYLQEIGRIRLLRPDEEIELARKIADLLYLEELAAQFESDNGREPDKKEWAALVENAAHSLPPAVDAGPTSQGKNGAVQPAPCGVDCQEIHESRPEFPGPDSRGQPWPDPRR
jgi:RNA polymerase primary sigma factor